MRAPIPLSQAQVQTTRATQRVQADPGAMGGNIARGGQQLGQNITVAGKAIEARRKRMQEEDDAASALDAYSRASDELRTTLRGEGGYYERTGREAADGYQDAETSIRGIGSNFRNGLSEGATQAYDRLWGSRQESALNSASTHAARERKAFLESSAAAVAEQSGLDAVEAWSNSGSVAEHIARGETALRARGAGKPAEAVALEVGTFRSKVALSAITAAVDSGDARAAEALSERFAESFIGDDGATATKLIEGANLVQRRQEATDEIFARFGSDGASARRHIRETYEGDLEDAILRDYNTRQQEGQITATQQKEQVLEQAIAAIEGGASLDDLPPSQFLALTSEERKWLANRQQGVPTVTDFAAYNRYAEMTPAGLKMLDLGTVRRELADSEYKRVEGWVRGARDGGAGAPESLRTLNQTLDDTIRTAGITGKKKADAAKGEIRQQLDRWSMQYQESNGREPTDQELEEQASALSTRFILERRDLIPFNDRKGRVFEGGISVRGVPEEHVGAVLGALGNGETVRVDEAVVTKLYEDAIGHLGSHQRTPENIEMIVRAMRADAEAAGDE